MQKMQIGQAEVDFDASSINGLAGSYSVEPKVIDVLRALSQTPGIVVSRDALINQVWGTEFGGDERLSRAISLLRKAFGDTRGEYQYIETVSKRGYRLIAPIEIPQSHAAGHSTSTSGFHSVTRSTETSPPPNSIAVLPFAVLSSTGDQDYLADGITEEILHTLTKIDGLKVTGRNSSFALKNRSRDAQNVGRTLNVAFLLEGSLRQQQGKVRITVQLVQTHDGFHLWSETYDSAVTDIFALQDRIARSIVSELAEILPLVPQQSQKTPTTRDPEAYSLFLQGRQLTHHLNGQVTIPTGIDLLKRAVHLDPHFADAWAWLALAQFIVPEFARTPDWQQLAFSSREASNRAIELDPSSSIGLLVRALATCNDLKFDLAAPMFEEALNSDPNNVETMAGYGLIMMGLGLHDKARPYLEKVIKLDPLCGIWYTTYGGILLAAGEFEKSEIYFRKSFDLGFGAAAFGVAHRMAQRGETEEAIIFLRDNFDALGPVERAELASPLVRQIAYAALLRDNPIAKWVVNAALQKGINNRKTQPTSASVIRFLFLDRPEAFMRHVLEKPNPYIGYTVGRVWEPTDESRNIRTHNGFQSFVHQIGLVRAWKRYGFPDHCTRIAENKYKFT